MAIREYLRSNSQELVACLVVLFLSYKAVVYIQRLYFHPLSAFPGPKLCAASRLYEFYWDCVKHGRMWTRLPVLHQKYGQYWQALEQLFYGDILLTLATSFRAYCSHWS